MRPPSINVRVLLSDDGVAGAVRKIDPASEIISVAPITRLWEPT
jgi:hypothetical protein